MVPNSLIKAVIIDIDGCLSSKSFGQPLDLESLHAIQEISQKWEQDPAIPMLILNTGRDLNHTELMAKILDAFHYFIIEMGAAVVMIRGAQLTIEANPQITPERLTQFQSLQSDFLKKFPQYEKYLQFGKRYMISFLFEVGDPLLKQCVQDLQKFIELSHFNFIIDEGHNFINIIFPNINKGDGLDLLFSLNPELNSHNIAGIGDSIGDWDFLKMCNFSACPHNANQDLSEKCHYTAIDSEARGTLEILKYIIKRNQNFIEHKQKQLQKPKQLIKAVIVDINGTIDSKIFGKALQLEEIKKIRDLIHQSQNDPVIPKIILNTGWDINYTSLYTQLLNDFEYHIIERGAAIISIDGPQIHIYPDPKLTSEKIDEIARFQRDFISKFPQYRRLLQMGKKYMLSFQFEVGSLDKEECFKDLNSFMQDNNYQFDFENGPNFINISVPEINKGTGLSRLVEMIPELNYENIAGIGDSDGDWDYLKLCALKTCPSNASLLLKENCDYIAGRSETQGTLEIIERIIQWNLDLV